MPGSSSRPHLWEIDVIRLLTFTAVICVHSLAFTQEPGNQVAAGFMMLLQFGRELFFAISGFVLVYSSIGRDVRPLSFWRRRVPYVAVPYVVWSVIYYELSLHTSARGPWSWAKFGHDLLYGGAEFHLYFLVVTLQLYLVFPWLVRFVRWTSSRAVPVLVVVGVANLVWLGFLHSTHMSGWPGWFWRRAYELLPTYSIYVLAGGYAALHLEKVKGYLVTHHARMCQLAALAAAVALAAYAYQLGWLAPRSANAVVQPAMFATCVAAVLATAVLADKWVGWGMPGQTYVKIGSDISFGVYLAHPLVLTALLDHGFGNGHQVMPSWIATVLAILGASVGASLLALAARKTPFALPLIGRARVRGRDPARQILTEVSAAGNRPLISQG